MEFVRLREGEEEWLPAVAGDCIHVPGNEWHGFRNASPAAARMLTFGMGALGAFFEEASKTLESTAPVQGPPSPESVEKLKALTAKYGQAFYRKP